MNTRLTVQGDHRRIVHAAFMRVLNASLEQREAFIKEACAGDLRIEAEVRKLLAAAESSGRFLETPALENGRHAEPDVPDAVGNYLVVGVLGVGGMATVYEAIQDSPHRRVALKVLHQNMISPEMYQRFRFETETLAKLQHPGIAQIYEAGAAQLGQPTASPFFAMELIPDAVPITDYADRHALSIRERILMFASVCDAVHHGHQHGVIHRDLKPGNVLVGADGRAKVIDFGVARATDPGAEPLTSMTDARQLIGTLNYMSPEQCGAGDDIDIRTDVYSLGVLLYRLICGRLPYELEGMPLPAALHRIIHEAPRQPEFQERLVHRGLDAILLRAIEKDPDRRYDSASALALDLRRLLAHQAIEARPPGVIEQCRLFARRNRALVVGVVSVCASVILLSAISTIFALRLSEEVDLRRSAELQTMSERDLARWQAYTAQIAGALSAMQTGEFLQMRTRLDAASAHPKEWEWGFLSRLAGRSLSTVEAHDDMIMSMAFCPTGTRYATGAIDGSILLWSTTESKPLASFRSESEARVSAMSFTRDGRGLVTGDEEGVLRVLSSVDLREIAAVALHPNEIRSIVCMPDSTIAATDIEGNARRWTAARDDSVAFLPDQPGGVVGLELSPDEALLASFNGMGDIWVRDASDLSVVQHFVFPDRMTPRGINEVRFSRDGHIGATGESGLLLVWDVEQGDLVHSIQVARGVNTIRSLGFSNDSSLVAAGLIHRGIVICSLKDGSIVGELGGHTDAVAGVHFFADDSTLVSSSWDRTVRTWRTDEFEAPSGTKILRGHTDRARAVAFSPDGSLVASAAIDGRILLWDPDLGVPLAEMAVADTPVYCMDFCHKGDFLAAGYADGRVRVWNTRTARIETVLEGHKQWIASVDFDPSSTRVVAGCQDGTARVWDVQTREETHLLVGHTERVNSVRFSSDGRTIATASRDRAVVLWDAETGLERSRQDDHDADVFAILFSADGKHVYSGSRDQTVRVRDAHNGASVQTISGHGQNVTCLSLNPDGTRLAAGSWFGEVVLFDVATHDIIASFRANDSAIRGIAFSPDGRWLSTASFDTTIRLFDSATREESDQAKERAETSLARAQRTVQTYLRPEHSPPDARVLMTILLQAGHDPGSDPWLRKAILGVCAPPRVP